MRKPSPSPSPSPIPSRSPSPRSQARTPRCPNCLSTFSFVCSQRDAQIFDEPEAKASTRKPESAKRPSELTVERGEGELYDRDKKMSRLLKFQSTIQRCPSQVVRWRESR